jgi:shikimate kinase
VPASFTQSFVEHFQVHERQRTVYVLVGPKGSGKSYIGALIERTLHIEFFRVEDVWLSLGKAKFSNEYIEKGFCVVERKMHERLAVTDQLIIESTASFDYFDTFFKHLSSRYHVKLVQVSAPVDLCFERIRSRNQATQVSVSDEMVAEINKRAVAAHLKFDLQIDNAVLSDKQIVDKFRVLLDHPTIQPKPEDVR